MNKCLIIDDDREFCQRIHNTLSSVNLSFSAANSSYEAHSKIKNIAERLDLILLDLTLDEPLDGLRLIEDIKKFRPNIPIIIATKDAYEGEVIANIMKHGVVNFLSKGKFEPVLWAKAFHDAIALSKTYILLAYEAIDMPFAGWIETALLHKNCTIIRQCADYNAPKWGDLIQQNNYLIPILSPESTGAKWFKQMSKAVTKTKSTAKVIPLKYRPCPIDLLTYEPGRLVNFCDDLDAFFVGRKRLIEKIVEINEIF
jgi:CheY-like chemotaxis protein